MPHRLVRNEWFAELPPEVVEQLAQRAHRRKLADGQMLYARGDAPQGLYGVVSGRVELRASAPDGREIVATVHEPGNWFGEVSLFDGAQRVHDAFADGATELLVIPTADFHRWLATHPELYPHFTRMLCRKLRLALGVVEALVFLPLSARVAARLLTLAEAYGRPSEDGLLIDRHLPQDLLARMVAAGRQAVSRELKALEAAGAIRVAYGKVVVTDMDRLREQAGDALRLAALQDIPAAPQR